MPGLGGPVVTRKMGIRWHLRLRMAEKGMFQTSDLVPLLAERGIHLSREQVFRLVTQAPQRLSMDTLAALCDILELPAERPDRGRSRQQQVRKAAGEAGELRRHRCGAARSAARTCRDDGEPG